MSQAIKGREGRARRLPESSLSLHLFGFLVCRMRLRVRGRGLPRRMRPSQSRISWAVSAEHPLSVPDHFRSADLHRHQLHGGAAALQVSRCRFRQQYRISKERCAWMLRDDSPMSFPARKLGTKRALLPYLFRSCRIGQLLLVLASGAELLRGAHVLRALVFNYAPCAVLRAENRAEKSVKRVLGANSGFLSYAIRARARARGTALVSSFLPRASFVAATRREKLEFRLRAMYTDCFATN